MPVLKAVYDERLEKFLEKLGLLDKIEKGLQKCHRCDRIITLENFGSVKKQNGELIVFCNHPECIASCLKD
jgi:hypothetical protein